MNIHLFVKFMMDFLRKTICLLVVYVLQMTIGLYGKPDLDFFMNATCPASKPYKCEPYAICYDSEHYCDNGEVKSCFPPKISTNDTAILEWCGQSNSSNLLDATCRFACYSHFESTTEKRWSLPSCFPQHNANDSESLFVWCQKQIKEDFKSLPHPSCKYVCIDEFNASVLYQSSPCDNGNSSDYTWIIPVVLVPSILMMMSIVANIVLTVQLCKSSKGHHPMEVNDGLPEGENGHTAEQAAPPVEDARETDININRPALRNKNLPSTIHSDQVQGRSLDNKNGAPVNQDEHDQARSPDNQKVVPRNQLDSVEIRNTQNEAPRNQHEQDHDRNINIQNGAPRSQYEHNHGINSQSESLITQHDPVQRRSTNTQNGALMNVLNPGQCINTQSRTPVSQHKASQGRSTQNVTQIKQLDHDQSTRNNQDDQARYYQERRATVTSPSSVSFGCAFGGTSEEQYALIPGSDDSLSGEQTQRD